MWCRGRAAWQTHLDRFQAADSAPCEDELLRAGPPHNAWQQLCASSPARREGTSFWVTAAPVTWPRSPPGHSTAATRGRPPWYDAQPRFREGELGPSACIKGHGSEPRGVARPGLQAGRCATVVEGSPQTRRSHASASSAPPPSANPFTTATVGIGRACAASLICHRTHRPCTAIPIEEHAVASKVTALANTPPQEPGRLVAGC